MREIKFHHYYNDRVYESHNGKIVFDDSLINKLDICKDMINEKYGIELYFEYCSVLFKKYNDINLYMVYYNIHINFPPTLYKVNDVYDIVVGTVFKYLSIPTEYRYDTEFYSECDNNILLGKNIKRKNIDTTADGIHIFENVIIPHMMYCERIISYT